MEDPRIVKIEDLYYLTYTGLTASMPWAAWPSRPCTFDKREL
jgi:predicted GH43/DUF377 family glycosyl hydrolase